MTTNAGSTDQSAATVLATAPTDTTGAAQAGAVPANQPYLWWLFVGILVILVALIVYFVVAVVVPLSSPSPYFKKVTDSFLAKTGAEGQPDPLSVDLAVMLEYASADIRTGGVQVASALFAGLLFAVIGVLLLAAGLSGALNFGAESEKGKVTLSTTTPGIACLLFGAIIISLGILRDVRRPFQGEIKRPVAVTYHERPLAAPQLKLGGAEPSVTRAERADKDKGNNKVPIADP